ncbi:MAG: Lrp/AsnC family transcriptional regulator [bacterium]
MDLSIGERTVLNQLQGGFPVTERPFEALQSRLGMETEKLVDVIRDLEEKNYLSRFGLVLNPSRMGGSSRLAAMEVPSHDLEETIRTVNESSTVTHNYLRNHDINVWFVLSAEKPETIDESIEQLESTTGYEIYSLPKLREYYVGLRFYFEEDGTVRTVNVEDGYGEPSAGESPTDNEFHRRLILETQTGLPVRIQPYRSIADSLAVQTGAVVEGLRELKSAGVIKRIGCVPNHYGLGIEGNGMCVFDVPDEDVDAVGSKLGDRPEVTHCYKRPRYRPEWPYNLFAMVHDRTRSKAIQKVDQLRRELDLKEYPYRVLFSERKCKKTGLQL